MRAVCCCSLAGTAACEHCSNNPFATEVNYRSNTVGSLPNFVERKTGRWIRGANNSGYIRCSLCGYNDVVERLDYFIYCPNCGARMVDDG